MSSEEWHEAGPGTTTATNAVLERKSCTVRALTGEITVSRVADARYADQSHELRITVAAHTRCGACVVANPGQCVATSAPG